MAKNIPLRTAKKVKNDEFYTRLEDIEEELSHYWEFLKGKVVYCNADDPYESNFFNYFVANFNKIGLKKLITTNYSGDKQLALFDSLDKRKPTSKASYKVEVNVVDKYTNPIDVLRDKRNKVTMLKGNGDFRSKECVALLDEADIVVTNPPFSLFREYIDLLIEHKKDFIILSNFNSVTYANVFKNLISGKIRLGYIFHRNLDFMVPDNSETWDKTGDDGKKYKTIGIAWYTTLPIDRKPRELILTKSYRTEEYPKYANYDAINVDSIADIPKDYYDLMGVPITFMDYYDPEEFELLGAINYIPDGKQRKMLLEALDKDGNRTGKHILFGEQSDLLLKYVPGKHEIPTFMDVETGELYVRVFKRLIIRRKRVKKH